MRWLIVALGAGLGLSAACLVGLDQEIACGDAHRDAQAGEECDPMDPSYPGGVPDQHDDACARIGRPMGTPRCDPMTCTVVADLETCGLCGDDIADEELGEECDGEDLAGNECPLGGQMRCVGCRLDDSQCNVCGNGEQEAGEECDFNLEGFATERECEGMAVPGNPEENYSYGMRSCRQDCTWDLSGCGLCENGEIDDAIVHPSTGETLRAAEACDGTLVDLEVEASACQPVCGTTLPGVRCDLSCDQGCLDVTVIDPSAPRCCVRSGSSKPAALNLPCCCELDYPDRDDICPEAAGGVTPETVVCPFPRLEE